MKLLKIFVTIFCILSPLSALSHNKVVIRIPPQQDKLLKIPAMDLQIGESGIITRQIKDNEFIIANATVADINNGVATIIHTPFNAIKQEYMPMPIGEPKEGDKIIFRILYNHAIAIAPNQNTYQAILQSNPNLSFVNSDIFASYLSKNGVNMPKPKDFAGFCAKFDVGLVLLATSSNILTLDCQSLNVLEKKAFTHKENSTKLPFFTRFSDEGINELFKVKDFSDYFVYYGMFDK